MKYLIPLLLVLLCPHFTYAQNMVPNGDFEQYSTCPVMESQLSNCTGWHSYHDGTSDYYNTCNSGGTYWGGVPDNRQGYQLAANGNAYAGICSHLFVFPAIEYREYLTRPIIPLTTGIRYDVSFSASLTGASKFSSNTLGVWFYNTGPSSILGVGALRVTPQVSYGSYGYIRDSTNWVRLESDFIADSAYDNIVIGNFTPDVLLVPDTVYGYEDGAYYYIDSVVVKTATGIINLFTDTTICTTDTFNVNYLIRNKLYSTTNTFSVQLSNSLGTFSSGTTIIGSVVSDTSGTIRCVVPTSITPSHTYRIRIISSNILDSSKQGRFISIGTVHPQVNAIADTAVCPGQTIHLNASASPSVNTTYHWFGPAGYKANAQSNNILNATTNMSGNYIVVAKLFGCIDQDTMYAAVVNGNNALKFKISNPICEDDTLKLSVTALGTATSFTWSGPNAFSSARKDTIIAGTQNIHNGNYSIIASYSGACYAHDTINVIVKPLPASFTTASNSPICDNTNLNLSSTTTSSGVSYSWSGPNSFTSAVANPVISPATLAANGDYYITATLNGCSIKDTVSVQVTPIPGRPITTANSPVCVGQNINLIANSINGTTYFWEGPGGFNVITQNPVLPNANLSMAGNYRVRAVTNACISIEDTINVIVIAAPFVGIYPSPRDSICQGSPITFIGTPTNGGISPQYQWYRNGVAVRGATSRTPSITPVNDKDIFYCLMTTIGVCADPYTDTSNIIPITVLPWLAPSITIAANPNTPVSGGQMINFTATPKDAGKAPTYQWKRNGVDIIGAVSNIWGANNLDNGDTICVIVNSNYLCPNPLSAKSNCIVVQVNTTGIDNTTLLNGISIYPNPVTNELIIDGITEKTTIQLFDVIGKLVYNAKAAGAKEVINTSSLAAGTYMLQLVKPDGQKLNAKITKQ